MHRFLLEDRVAGFSCERTSTGDPFRTYGIEGVVTVRKKSAAGSGNSYRN